MGIIILLLLSVRLRQIDTPIGIPNKIGVKKDIPFIPILFLKITSLLFFLENFLKYRGNFLTKNISISCPT
jgi:hypothetical protein